MTFEELLTDWMSIWVGELGQSPTLFDFVTPRELRKSVERNNAKLQASWEQARYTAYFAHRVAGFSVSSPSALHVFPWEKVGNGDEQVTELHNRNSKLQQMFKDFKKQK